MRAGVRTVVHLGLSAVFGAPDKCPITVDSPLRPTEAYGRAKLEGEESVH